MNRQRVLVVLVLFFLCVCAGSPFVGMTDIPAAVLFKPSAGTVAAEIFWNIRVPRVCISMLTGAALALSGMTFQALFRNPLATPFTLGVSSGASLGAALYVWTGMSFALWGISGISVFAFTGAVLSIALVYGLIRAKGAVTPAAMLLAGVCINFSFSSLILLIQYLADFSGSFKIVRWLMGSLETIGFEPVKNIVLFVLCGCIIIFCCINALNLMSLGEEIAVSRGVAASKIRGLLFFATSLMVGSVVAVCGPIGFVGMMVPHICRLLVGPDHRYLMPASLLFGSSFLTVCDALARTLIAPAEIPVGVITAVLGGPFFLWLLFTWPGERITA